MTCVPSAISAAHGTLCAYVFGMKPFTRMPARQMLCLFVAVAAVISACSSGSENAASSGTKTVPAAAVPAPTTAWERAGQVTLPARKGTDMPGLHNVFVLSKNIISGSEPHGREGLASVAKLGVKTVISVDGQVPDAEEARALGMRYVHLPIQYKQIAQDEWMALTKTFRECTPPFYVHCFHGQHRGPTAAAVGRRTLDAANAEQAIAEMRHWMGTAQMYEGLYSTILTHAVPSASSTAAFTFAFPEAQRPDGIAEHMTHIARAHDALKALNKLGWKADAEHPDLDAGNEARKLVAQMDANWAQDAEPLLAGLADEQRTATTAAHALLQSLEKKDLAAASAAFLRVDSSCKACHQQFRNH